MKHLESAFSGRNKIFYYIATLLIVFIAMNTLGMVPLGFLVINKLLKSPEDFDFYVKKIGENGVFDLGYSANTQLACLLFSFFVGFFIFALAVKILNKRTITQVINGTNNFRWKHLFWGVGIWFVLLSLTFILTLVYSSPEDYYFEFNASKFILLVLISLFFIPFQSALEEIIFRGYLAQGIASKTGSRLLALIIPTILFGVLHLSNPEVKEFGVSIMLPQYLLFGLFFGITSILDDGIELAIGAHITNNLFFSLFFTNKASVLQTDALFHFNTTSIDPIRNGLELLICGIIFTLFFYKKYNWSFSVFREKVRPNAIEKDHSVTSDTK